jgi:tRNA(fMet)-specific endonuclease VapC
LIVETTFLVDLERELRRDVDGPALELLDRLGAQPLYLTFTIAGELAAGVSLSERARWEELLSPFHVLACNQEVAWRYGTTYRYLQQQGRLIGGNDLWIAAAALAYAMPIVTRNIEHFRRVPGLEVIPYAE